MKKFTKIMSLVLAMVLCVGIGVGATLAWLTDQTEVVTNTFAAQSLIKDKNFNIWEHVAKTNEDGTNELLNKESTLVAHLTKKNEYKRVLPGVNINKDPFVRVEVNEESYIYMEVVPNTLPATMKWTVDKSNWDKMTVKGPHEGDLYVYKQIVKPADKVKDINIITGKQIEVTKDFDPASLGEGKDLSFYAYAMQAASFKGENAALDAWNAAGFTAKPITK